MKVGSTAALTQQRAPAVRPLYRRETTSEGRLGDGSERHRGASRRADAQRLEGIDDAAVGCGVAHHDPHFVLAALDAVHLLAVERLTHLAAEVGQGDSERFARRRDREPEFGLADAVGVGHAEDARVAPKLVANLAREGAQIVQVVARDANLDPRSEALDFRQVVERRRLGKGAHRLAPAVGDLARLDGPALAGGELHRHFGQVRARGLRQAADHARRRRLRAGRDHYVANDVLPELGGQVVLEYLRLPGQLRNRARPWRPG